MGFHKTRNQFLVTGIAQSDDALVERNRLPKSGSMQTHNRSNQQLSHLHRIDSGEMRVANCVRSCVGALRIETLANRVTR